MAAAMAAMITSLALPTNLHALAIISVLAPNPHALAIIIALPTELEAFTNASVAVPAFSPDLDSFSIVVIVAMNSNPLIEVGTHSCCRHTRPDDLGNDPGLVDEHHVFGLVDLDVGNTEYA